MKTVQLVLGALLLAACGRDSGPDADSPEKRAAYERYKRAVDAFDSGDLATAKARYQDLVDSVRASGERRGRSYYLDLARIHACLGEGEAAERVLKEYSDLQSPVPEDLGRFWSGLDMGLIHNTLGNTAEARKSFQLAIRALDQAPKKEDWMEAGRLLARWLILHLPRDPGAPFDDAEFDSVSEGLGSLRRPDYIYLHQVKSMVDELDVCDWNREAEILRGYFQELGLVKGPFVPEMPEATVTSQEARFSLPASPHREWQWFRPASPDSREFAWSVGVTRHGLHHEVGVWLMKPAGAAPRRGSLDELVRAGWAGVWKFSEDGKTIHTLNDTNVRARVEGNRVIITLDDPELIRQLFAGHPLATRIVKAPGKPLGWMDFPID